MLAVKRSVVGGCGSGSGSMSRSGGRGGLERRKASEMSEWRTKRRWRHRRQVVDSSMRRKRRRSNTSGGKWRRKGRWDVRGWW